MTKAEARRFLARLNRTDEVHAQMGRRLDELKQDLLKLQLESQEMRSDLEEAISDAPERRSRRVARREAKA